MVMIRKVKSLLNRFLHITFNENSVKEHELAARSSEDLIFFVVVTALDLHAALLNSKLSRQ